MLWLRLPLLLLLCCLILLLLLHLTLPLLRLRTGRVGLPLLNCGRVLVVSSTIAPPLLRLLHCISLVPTLLA